MEEKKEEEKTEAEKIEVENARLEAALEKKKELQKELEEIKNKDKIGGETNAGTVQEQSDPVKEKFDREVKRIIGSIGR